MYLKIQQISERIINMLSCIQKNYVFGNDLAKIYISFGFE